mmetsp:Transcript_23094/g.70945  ORF Transcript_23094/g.70945 Transcript_23094/m.70945 type:complete len:218 (+) Transcript_23094:464-1117(+)
MLFYTSLKTDSSKEGEGLEEGVGGGDGPLLALVDDEPPVVDEPGERGVEGADAGSPREHGDDARADVDLGSDGALSDVGPFQESDLLANRRVPEDRKRAFVPRKRRHVVGGIPEPRVVPEQPVVEVARDEVPASSGRAARHVARESPRQLLQREAQFLVRGLLSRQWHNCGELPPAHVATQRHERRRKESPPRHVHQQRRALQHNTTSQQELSPGHG